MKQYYYISLKWTSPADNIMTFWRPVRCGYAQILEHAGVYDEPEGSGTEEGILSVEKHIVDALVEKISGKRNEWEYPSFTVLPNTGQVRRALGFTVFDLNHKNYGDYFYGLKFKDEILEIKKRQYKKGQWQVKAKETVDEFWCYDIRVDAETRGAAVSAAKKEWCYSLGELDFMEFKSKLIIRKVQETVFGGWEELS